MADVFISYSSLDKSAADKVCHFLESQGIRCWIAPRDILPGAQWGGAIIDAIGQSAIMVLLFSSHSNISPQVMREVERAVHKGLPIIPLRLENITPSPDLEYFISASHWLDAPNGPSDDHLKKLADTIALLLPKDHPPLRTPFVGPPRKRRRSLYLACAAAALVGAGIAVTLRATRERDTSETRPIHTPALVTTSTTHATTTSLASHPALVPPASEPSTMLNSIGMTLVRIPAGEFNMGAPESDGLALPEERPQHRVIISTPFYLGAYEVTQEQALKVLGKSPGSYSTASPARTTDDNARRPADALTFQDAQQFCRRLSRLAQEQNAGRTYRLPTEAEWEYACRAGTTTPYIFGNKIEIHHANYDDPRERARAGRATRSVGRYAPNAWGLYDIIGNAQEWCSDFKAPYPAATLTDPRGPDTGAEHVRRGGNSASPPDQCRSSARTSDTLPRASSTAGLRVVCTIVPLNTLTAEEKRAGWRLLFNGENLNGWQQARSSELWQCRDGALFMPPSKNGGFLATTDQFRDFEITFDADLTGDHHGHLQLRLPASTGYVWPHVIHLAIIKKVPNKHIIVNNDLPADTPPDGFDGWNHVLVRMQGKHLHYELNQQTILDIDIDGERWNAYFKGKQAADFAKSPIGFIGFESRQGFAVRNVKIRTLPPPASATSKP